MDYLTFEQKRKDLVELIGVCPRDYDFLMCLTGEFEKLAQQMIEHIKHKETLITPEEPENVIELEISEDDETWLQHYLSLDK